MRKPYLKQIKDESRFSVFNVDQSQTVSPASQSVPSNSSTISETRNGERGSLSNIIDDKIHNSSNKSLSHPNSVDPSRKLRLSQETLVQKQPQGQDNPLDRTIKKETNVEITNVFGSSSGVENDLLKKVFDFYDLNQFMSENSNHPQTSTATETNNNNNNNNNKL
jgi:hypothetical protein